MTKWFKLRLHRADVVVSGLIRAAGGVRIFVFKAG